MLKSLRRTIRGLLPKVTVTNRAPDREFVKRYVCAKLPRDGIMVDIGAGTGGGPESFISEAGLDPKNCVLVEACPDNFRILAERCPTTRLLNVAISDHEGIVPFYVTDDPTWEGSSKSNSLVEGVVETKHNSAVRKIEVPSLTLNGLFSRHNLDRVDFMMLNCEGAEYFIFSNGISCLRNTRMVWLEFHGASRKMNKFIDKKREIFALFEDAGFSRVAGLRPNEIDDSFVHTMVLFERLK